MNTILVWVLVSVGHRLDVVYSPPMPDQATCEFVQKSVNDMNSTRTVTKCVQIRTVVMP